VIVAVIRETLATGTILGYQVLPQSWPNWVVMSMAPGGFFVLGLLIWGIREWSKLYEEN
jgi:Na+-transporting NADH:ubiquinone oxidoreductase subunit NqrD